jgi:carbamoyltransferase
LKSVGANYTIELMNIMGINYIFHDSSSCLLSDGALVSAVEEERLSRKKHSAEFPRSSARTCVDIGGIAFADIDHIAVSVNPRRHSLRKLAYTFSLGRRSLPFLDYEYFRLNGRHRAFSQWVSATWPAYRRPQIHFVDHHLSHVGGSFFASPYEHAALLSLDGWGEWSTGWLGIGTGTDLTPIQESMFPHSLGCFYSAATEFCGFKYNYDEGKTMGLAPFGDPGRFYDIVANMVRISEDGRVQLDLSFFDFQFFTGKFCGEKFYRTFGAARLSGDPIEEHHRDVAAAFQRVLEDRILDLCWLLERKTSVKRLVLAGGVALNSVANGRVLRESRFEDIYVMPGAGDNGTSIGAAYYVANAKLAEPRRYVPHDPFLGTEYGNTEIKTVLDRCKLTYRDCPETDVCQETARLLQKGCIVGWFQGRMEFGPRSLGNRSILADPTRPDMKDRINAEVKYREAFRPFAPSVPREDAQTYFDIHVDSPFMLMVCDVRPDKRSILPAITHVDGTARLQTVDREINPRYHQLLREFGKLSGVPVLLNTSFNVMDEPIVESPVQALRCFFSTGLDALVMGNMIVLKRDVPPRGRKQAGQAVFAAQIEGTS